MTKIRSLTISLITILALFGISNALQAQWFGEDEIGGSWETFPLLRVDTQDPQYPNHEMTQGVYGYWEDSQTWHTVLNFYNGGIQTPYTWSQVWWKEPISMNSAPIEPVFEFEIPVELACDETVTIPFQNCDSNPENVLPLSPMINRQTWTSTAL